MIGYMYTTNAGEISVDLGVEEALELRKNIAYDLQDVFVRKQVGDEITSADIDKIRYLLDKYEEITACIDKALDIALKKQEEAAAAEAAKEAPDELC